MENQIFFNLQFHFTYITSTTYSNCISLVFEEYTRIKKFQDQNEGQIF